MELSELDETVKELGFNNRSDFVLFAIDLLSGFDKGFLNMIRSYSEGLKLPEYIIIQNFIIKQIALDQADREINGESPKLLDQFIFVSDGESRRIMTGEELYKILYGNYLKKFTSEYSEIIRKKEAAGAKLSDEEIEFLAIHEFNPKRSQDDEMQNLIEQFPELEDEIKLNFEINKKG